jgi:methionyl-tRNA formyltransferase
MKVGLYLMGQKGLRILQSLKNDDSISSMIVFVVSNEDKTIKNDFTKEIRLLSEELGIPFFWRKNFKNSIKADFYFAISWKWLIKENVEKLIVFHDSLLPKYRGFNPLVTALISGDKQIGVTAIRANAEFDKGNIVGQEKVKIKYPIKIQEAIGNISELYMELFLKTINKLKKNKLLEKQQLESKASYSLWRDEDDYFINWKDSADSISRFIDAVGYPYNGAKTNYDGRIIRILESEPFDDIEIANRCPGKIIFFKEKFPVVVCGKGLLIIKKVTEDESNIELIINKLRIKLK